MSLKGLVDRSLSALRKAPSGHREGLVGLQPPEEGFWETRGEVARLAEQNRLLEENARLIRSYGQISSAIASSLDEEYVISTLAREIVMAGLLRSLSVAVVDRGSRSIRIARSLTRAVVEGTLGPIRDTTGNLLDIKYDLDDPNITAEVARTGTMQIIDGWDDRFLDRWGGSADEKDERLNRDRYRNKASYFIPVVKSGEVLAVIATGSTAEQKEETLRKIGLMQPLVNQFAIALDNARLYRNLRAAEYDLAYQLSMEKLHRAVLELHSLDDLEMLARSALESLRLVGIAADVFGLNVFGEEKGTVTTWGVSPGGALAKTVKPLDYSESQQMLLAHWRRNEPWMRTPNPGLLEVPGAAGSQAPSVVLDTPFAGGTLAVGTNTKAAYSPEERQILHSFCEILSLGYQRIEEIENQKYLQEQLEIRQRMDSLGTLAGGIAHDLNNLFTPILLNLSALEKDAAGEQAAMIKEVSQNAISAVELIRQFQALSRTSTSELTSVDLHAPASAVMAILKRTTSRLIDKGLDFGAGQYFAMANQPELHQVFLNLATNAVEAIEEKGPRNGDYVRISAKEYRSKGLEDKTLLPKGDYVHLTVEDTGVGMSEATRKQIYAPFFTTKEKTTRKGQGLGLAMVYNIVTQKHRGYIDVESRAGAGSAFHVYLPAALTAPAVEMPSSAVYEGRGETVLLVDDEPAVLSAVGRAMEEFGYTVLRAENGIEGVALYKQHAPDVVILDLNMPLMSGVETFRSIREHDPQAKIIVSSGHSPEESRSGVLSQANACFPKPYTLGYLTRMLRTVLDSGEEEEGDG